MIPSPDISRCCSVITTGVGIYLIDAPHLYDRPGSPYHDTNLFAYTDNVLRFALLGWVGAEMASGLDPFWRPDVVHAHDWHAGLAPAYLAARGVRRSRCLLCTTWPIKAWFYAHHMNDIQLPWSFFNIHGLEFNGQISFPGRPVCTMPITLRQSAQPTLARSPNRSLPTVWKVCCNSVTVKGVFPAY